ncbi:MAG: hypothetical protein H6716_17375 [Polyangiaceae bacterium]|nr:hypothetical protein [Polyangiaceae bacterium]
MQYTLGDGDIIGKQGTDTVIEVFIRLRTRHPALDAARQAIVTVVGRTPLGGALLRQ